jgi:glutamate synthase domain-containing protein 2
VGIATQDPRLRARLDVATSAKRVEMFLKSTTSQLIDYARLCGRHATAHLCVDDLLAQDPDLARRLGIPSALPG